MEIKNLVPLTINYLSFQIPRHISEIPFAILPLNFSPPLPAMPLISSLEHIRKCVFDLYTISQMRLSNVRYFNQGRNSVTFLSITSYFIAYISIPHWRFPVEQRNEKTWDVSPITFTDNNICWAGAFMAFSRENN